MLKFESSYNDLDFNNYLLHLIKERLKRRSLFFKKEITYNGTDYEVDTLIESLYINKKIITFKEIEIIYHLVYDLNQAYWSQVITHFYTHIGKYYLRYKSHDKFITKQK